MIFLVAGFAAVVAGVYGSTYLFANAPAQQAAVPQQGTRVAVVNIGEVFNKYKRSVAFKAELENTLKPYKDKAKTWQDQIKAWDDALKSGKITNPADIANYQNSIKKNKRDLEDMGSDISRLLGKKQEENLVTLWKEVDMGISAVAKAYNYNLVLAFGDPIDKETLNLFPNVNRKMQAMDLGSTVPLYIDPSNDISGIVVYNLNKWLEPKGGAVQPTGGTK